MLRSLDDASGDRGAVDSACRDLHARYAKRLLVYAMNRGCDGIEAQDVVQEVFLRLFKARVLIPIAAMSAEAQAAHLFQTLRWVISAKRRRQYATRRISPLFMMPLELLPESGHAIPDPHTPVTLLERKFRVELIGRCFQVLRAELKPEIWQRLEEHLLGGSQNPLPLTGAQRVALLRGRRRLREMISSRSAEIAL